MTDPTPLSPAAQAVITAILEISPAPADEIAAAALRAATNEMSREWGYYQHHDFLRDIAAELESAQ